MGLLLEILFVFAINALPVIWEGNRKTYEEYKKPTIVTLVSYNIYQLLSLILSYRLDNIKLVLLLICFIYTVFVISNLFIFIKTKNKLYKRVLLRYQVLLLLNTLLYPIIAYLTTLL